jgi:hypothetical protein
VDAQLNNTPDPCRTDEAEEWLKYRYYDIYNRGYELRPRYHLLENGPLSLQIENPDICQITLH